MTPGLTAPAQAAVRCFGVGAGDDVLVVCNEAQRRSLSPTIELDGRATGALTGVEH